jgi:hypothetical protein
VGRKGVSGKKRGRTLLWGVELGEDTSLGRPKRADEAGGVDHSLNRGKARSTMFHKPEDDDAFEQFSPRDGSGMPAGCWLSRSCPTTGILCCSPRKMEA